MAWWIEHGKGAEAGWLEVIGKCFAQCRANLKMSVRELSGITGISPSHLLRIESGEFDFTITKFLRLTEALGLPSAWVIEPPLFTTRAVHHIRAGLEAERDFQSFTGNDEIKGGLVTDLILTIYRVVLGLLLSQNPHGLLDAINFPFRESNVRLRRFADSLDREMSHTERLHLVEALAARPFRKMKSLNLLDDAMLESFLVWSRENSIDYRRLRLVCGVPDEWPAAPAGVGGATPGARQASINAAENEKEHLTDAYGMRNVPDVKAQWPALLKDVIARTKPRGMKAALAADLGVAAPRINEWIKETGRPTAEVALKLRELFYVESWPANRKK